ncbi:PREDICTED: taste receptor type 2 member 7-like [Nanorana parkeri]|uniref:taste receptor type 2 member 7-like n=1 Tax=Nanorana parkeri TaxID=125878 RepID=UPI0008547705|nr:PREDICTED: taste receptor type 2 member 7-like [Nanorana parkeri]
MLPFNVYTTLLVGFSTIVLGCVFNSWTVHVNLVDWRRGLRLSPSDQILSLMAAINILLQIVLSVDMSLLQLLHVYMFGQFHRLFIVLSISLVTCNLWVTTWLCTYYCLKIVNFSRGILLALKMRSSALVPKLLVACVILSFGMTMVSHWNIYMKCYKGITGNSTGDPADYICYLEVQEGYRIAAFVALILPLLLTLVPIGVTLASLWRHTRRIKKNETESCRPQTQAHVRAARTMILLVTLHTAFYGVVFSFFVKSFNVLEVGMLFSWYFVLLYPMMQSVVIITGNSKLWKACHRIFSPKRIPSTG